MVPEYEHACSVAICAHPSCRQDVGPSGGVKNGIVAIGFGSTFIASIVCQPAASCALLRYAWLGWNQRVARTVCPVSGSERLILTPSHVIPDT